MPIGSPLEPHSYSLIWADSYGATYKQGLELVNKNAHRALLTWTGRCPPLMGVSKDESVSSQAFDDECSQRNREIVKLINGDSRINSAVPLGRWSCHLKGEGFVVDNTNKIIVWPSNTPKPEQAIDSQSQSDIILSSFNQTIDYLHNKGLRIFVAEEPPEFSQYPARTVTLGLIKGQLSQSLEALTSEAYAAVLSRQNTIQKAMSIMNFPARQDTS